MLHVHRKKCLEMEKQLQRSKKQKFSEGLLIGAALGVAIGAIAGLLVAPESGRETRGKLTKGVKGMCDKCMSMMPTCCCMEDEDLDFASDYEDGFDHDDQYHEAFSQEEPIEE